MNVCSTAGGFTLLNASSWLFTSSILECLFNCGFAVLNAVMTFVFIQTLNYNIIIVCSINSSNNNEDNQRRNCCESLKFFMVRNFRGHFILQEKYKAYELSYSNDKVPRFRCSASHNCLDIAFFHLPQNPVRLRSQYMHHLPPKG